MQTIRGATSRRRRQPNRADLVPIRIGDKNYLVNTTKIPYFGGFVRFHCRSSGRLPVSQVLTHSAIPYFDIINHAVKHGLRSIIVKMPPDAGLDQYHELCSSMDYLCIDVLGHRSPASIFSDLHRKERNIIPAARRGLPAAHRRVVRIARDSAFRLLYMFLMMDFKNDEVRYRDANLATELALSASGPLCQTEGGFARVLRQAYEERFVISDYQRRVVDNLLLFFDDAGYEAGSA